MKNTNKKNGRFGAAARCLLSAIALALALSCAPDDDGFAPFYGCLNGPCMASSRIALQNTDMDFVNSSIPTGETSYIKSVQFNGHAIAGGSSSVTVTSSQPLGELYFQIKGEHGYYVRRLTEADLVSSSNGNYVYSVLLQFSQEIDGGQLQFTVSGRTTREAVSTGRESEVQVIKAGTGAMQVSLSWDKNDDLDLYVRTPSGKTVYYGNKRAAATANAGKVELDVDANAACNNLTGKNAENIYLESPLENGVYVIGVCLFEKCVSGAGAKYNVSANFGGQFVTFSSGQSGKFADDDRADVCVTAGTITTRNGVFVQGGEGGQTAVDTVSFDANGGSGTPPAALKVISGSSVTLPSGSGLSRNGYTFGGWNTDSAGRGTTYKEGATYSPSGSITLYAKWDTASVVTPPSGSTFVDSRDNKTYKMVTIGRQTWMAENLNYDVPNNTTDVCYNNADSNCTKYGRLYNWSAAMGGASSSSKVPSGVQGACPAGWHLPSDAEWDTLVNYVGGASTAGTKLKSSTGWDSYSGVPIGTNEYGFSALPGGYGGSDGKFSGIGNNGSWWSATEYGSSYALQRYIHHDTDNLGRNDYGKTFNLSIRCVQDVSAPAVVDTVRFNANGGSGTAPAPLTVNAGGSVTLPNGNGLTRNGYTFGGWNTDSAGTGTNYSAGATFPPSGNITLYAKWNAVTGGGDMDVEMVYVSGGTFMMGCTSEQGSDCWSNESPSHSVTLSNYYIGKYEVTQGLWKAVMGSNPASGYGVGDNYPVYYVSWNSVQTFISTLNSKTGMNYRLPTEAEWEFAARGGNSSSGYKYSGSNTLGNVAWYWDNIPSQTSGTTGYGTQPVGTKSSNELGIYDMSGNVWEWVNDWRGSYSSSSVSNPTGPSSGSYRVGRGGSWYSDALSCRVSNRSYAAPEDSSNSLGFRLARSP